MQKGNEMNENTIQNNGEIEINLFDLGFALLKKWWMILICALFGALLMGMYTEYFVTPMYKSEATLYILNKTTSITSMADIQIGSALSSDFEVIATSKPVLDGAVEQIKKEEGINLTREYIASKLSVRTIDDTRLLVISVQDKDPRVACIVANTVAEVTASRMSEIMKSDPPTMAEWAEEARAPIGPNLTKNVALGFAVGAAAVCALLVILFLLDDKIKTEDDVAKYLGAPILANISYIDEKERERKSKDNKSKDNKYEDNKSDDDKSEETHEEVSDAQ